MQSICFTWPITEKDLLTHASRLVKHVNEKQIFVIIHSLNKSDNVNISLICKSINFACIITLIELKQPT